jgi:hypothetical protein
MADEDAVEFGQSGSGARNARAHGRIDLHLVSIRTRPRSPSRRLTGDTLFVGEVGCPT